MQHSASDGGDEWDGIPLPWCIYVCVCHKNERATVQYSGQVYLCKRLCMLSKNDRCNRDSILNRRDTLTAGADTLMLLQYEVMH